MGANEEYVKEIAQLKALPKWKLSKEAQQTIYEHLNYFGERKERTMKYKRWMGRLTIALGVMVILLFTPYVMGQIGGVNWLNTSVSPTEPPWEESPLFDVIDEQGRLIYKDYLRGIEGKIGFMDMEFAATEIEPGSKMFWYVWDELDQITNGALKALAVHQLTNESFILNETTLYGPFNGADYHALTTFEPFPLQGMWRVDVTIDEINYGSIYVYVKDEYIKSESVKFFLSKEDVHVGENEVSLEIDSAHQDEIIEVIVYPRGYKDKVEKIPFKRIDEFIKVGRGIVTKYDGQLKFDAPGQWVIEVLGEKMSVEVR